MHFICGDNCTVKLTDENGLGIANKTVNVTLTKKTGQNLILNISLMGMD